MSSVKNSDFVNAAESAYSMYPVPIDRNMDRFLFLCRLCYRPGGMYLDIGSYVNVYPVILRLMGMDVTIVDYFPQRSEPDEDRRIDKVLEHVYRKVGIRIIEKDVFHLSSGDIGTSRYDVISAFECMEHWHHSPRSRLKLFREALRSEHAQFIFSVPNICSLNNRVRCMIGMSPVGDYHPFFFEDGLYTGHIRELTVGEVRKLLKWSGFRLRKIYGRNNFINPRTSGFRSSLIWRGVEKLYERVPSLAEQLVVVAEKWKTSPIEDN